MYAEGDTFTIAQGDKLVPVSAKYLAYIAPSLEGVDALREAYPTSAHEIFYCDPSQRRSGIYSRSGFCDPLTPDPRFRLNPLTTEPGFRVHSSGDLVIAGKVSLPDHFLDLEAQRIWMIGGEINVQSSRFKAASVNMLGFDAAQKPESLPEAYWPKIVDFYASLGGCAPSGYVADAEDGDDEDDREATRA